MKLCKACLKLKVLGDFTTHNQGKYGRASKCKMCLNAAARLAPKSPNYKKNSVRHMRRKRGLPEPSRPEPATCECCGLPPNGRGAFHLDHDHKTGAFRGWLCYRCNMGIGLLHDDMGGVLNAVEYLYRSTLEKY